MKKFLSAFLAGLMITGNVFAASKADIDRAKLVALGFSPSPLGSIQQSILTTAQFQSVNGSGWVAMEGQSIAGSKLCTQFSICTLPDARNRYLRAAGTSDGDLLASQAQDTKLNGITANITAVNFEHSHVDNFSASISPANFEHSHADNFSASISPANFEHSHADNFSASISAVNFEHSHSHNISTVSAGLHAHDLRTARDGFATGISGDGGSSRPGYYINMDGANAGGYELSSNSAGSHTHTINGSVGADDVSASKTVDVAGSVGDDNFATGTKTVDVAGSVGDDNFATGTKTVDVAGSVGVDNVSSDTAVTFSNDGTETRPDSLVVNTFIKIN